MSNHFKHDFEYGKVNFCNSSENEDRRRGIDGFIGTMKVATRKYRAPLSTYGTISIRKRQYSKSEYDKIMAKEFEPILYIFDFVDCYIICRVEDIANCLKRNLFTEKPNPDGLTSGCYIQVGLLPHLLIPKPLVNKDKQTSEISPKILV